MAEPMHRYIVTAVSEGLADQLKPGTIIVDRFKGYGLQSWQFIDLPTGRVSNWFEAEYKEPYTGPLAPEVEMDG